MVRFILIDLTSLGIIHSVSLYATLAFAYIPPCGLHRHSFFLSVFHYLSLTFAQRANRLCVACHALDAV